MKLSELLAEHPTMDVELDDGHLYLDGVYIFRMLQKGDEPGDSSMLVRSTKHTDWIVKLGLVEGVHGRINSSWDSNRDD